MASGWTNKGKFKVLDHVFRATALPTNYFIGLATSAATPGPDTNTKSDLTEIATGNGYTAGGFSLTKNSTDFDVLTEDDTGDLALVQVKNVVWTASGGPIPASGNGARWAWIADGTGAGALIYGYWDLVSDRTVSDTQALTLIDLELRLTE